MKKGRVLAPSFHIFCLSWSAKRRVFQILSHPSVYIVPLFRPHSHSNLHHPPSPCLCRQVLVALVYLRVGFTSPTYQSYHSTYLRPPRNWSTLYFGWCPLCAVFLRALTAENAMRRVPRFSFFKQHKQPKDCMTILLISFLLDPVYTHSRL